MQKGVIEDIRPVLDMQRIYLDGQRRRPSSWQISLAFHLPADIDTGRLQRAFETLLGRYGITRTRSSQKFERVISDSREAEPNPLESRNKDGESLVGIEKSGLEFWAPTTSQCHCYNNLPRCKAFGTVSQSRNH